MCSWLFGRILKSNGSDNGQRAVTVRGRATSWAVDRDAVERNGAGMSWTQFQNMEDGCRRVKMMSGVVRALSSYG
jgi:hypothetical protein